MWGIVVVVAAGRALLLHMLAERVQDAQEHGQVLSLY
jgi:hypothetical protein